MSCHTFWMFPNLKSSYQNLRPVSSQLTELHSRTRGQPCFLAPSVHVCVLQSTGPWGKLHVQQKGVYSGAAGAGGGLLGAVFASNVPCGLLDGAFGNKGRVFSITRLQGLFQFLCCEGKGRKKKKKKESSVFRLNAVPGNPEQLKCSST